MPLPLGPTALLLLLILLPFPAIAKKGVGVSGPDQIFTLYQGRNLSSYVRIYNTGDEITTYLSEAKGNASSLMYPQTAETSIEAGENAKLVLTYAASSDQVPGLYVGSILISVKSQQISPGVNKEIMITVLESEPNEEPKLRFLSPSPGRISGVVDVTVEPTDKENDTLEIAILVDGVRVASSTTYEWDTRNESDGSHILAAEASDGTNIVRIELVVVIDNSNIFNPAILIATMLGGFMLVLAIAVAYSHKKRKLP